MILVDDRTDDEKRSHTVIVLMTDRFMSGWGGAGNGPSYAGWACLPEDVNKVESWVRRRSEAMRIRIVDGDYRPRNQPEGHCHIYVVHDHHGAKGGTP